MQLYISLNKSLNTRFITTEIYQYKFSILLINLLYINIKFHNYNKEIWGFKETVTSARIEEYNHIYSIDTLYTINLKMFSHKLII